jgi:hypothetical protein
LKCLAVALALIAAVLPGTASADIITFSTGAPYALFFGPTVEGNFSYELFSGGLFIDGDNGNPGAEIEGGTAAAGGTLKLVRDDVVDGLFTFDQADVQQFNFGAVPVGVEGYLGGVLQGTDSLITSSVSLVHTTLASSNLNGLSIDELRVILDASNAPASWEGVDNIVVSRVPEPNSIVLLGAGLGLIALYLRRRSRPPG